jgi:predicted SAM-dependent methyltransferase
MKLYVGSRDYKPENYLTVDIDESMKPDILADITKKLDLADGAAEEIVASHVLEHIDWPDSFTALSEFSRVLQVGGVLKIAIPDMTALVRMMMSGDCSFHVVGLIYGCGGRTSRFEQHRYGFTAGMMIDILDILGFGEFDWWNSDFGDASNGWVPRAEQEPMGMSLNIRAIKLREPAVDVAALYQRLVERPLSEFHSVAAEIGVARGTENAAEVAKLYQRIHFQLIEANARIRYLEDQKRREEADISARQGVTQELAQAEARIAAQAAEIAAQARDIDKLWKWSPRRLLPGKRRRSPPNTLP